MIIFIEAFRVEWAFQVDIAAASFSPGASDEVVNTFLRLNTLIDMVVREEDDVDSVANEERLQHFAQFKVRSVFFARGVERMVKDSDLPPGDGRSQFSFQPSKLCAVTIGGIEHEQIHHPVTLLQGK